VLLWEYAVLNFQLSLNNAFFIVSAHEYACKIFYVKGTIQLQVTATFVSCRYENFEPCTSCWMSLLAPVSDLSDIPAVRTWRNLAGSQTQEMCDGSRRAALDGCFAGVGYSMVNKSSHIFLTRSGKRKLYKVYCLLHNVKKTKLNTVALVCKLTIPTEWPPLVGEVSANLCG
jgi:hypothetical protein